MLPIILCYLVLDSDMAPRKKSVLLFISEPPCVEMFNETHVVLSAGDKNQQVEVRVGAELTFKRPKETESYTGRVVAYGE